jgi:hypothetical protein
VCAAASAQASRRTKLPPQALRGVLRRHAAARGAAQRPAGAPGARRAHPRPDNLLLMSGAAQGQPLLVHYTLDLYGQVHDVPGC